VTINSRASIASWGPNRYDVFFLSNTTPPDVWHGWSLDNGVTIGGWDNWGHPTNPTVITLLGGEDAASWGDLRVDVFATGTDGNMWHRYWDHWSFPDWENLGLSALTSGPGAAGGGEGNWWLVVDVIDNHVHEYDFTNGAFSAWIDNVGAPSTRPDLIAY
jgi:hypothetical protein